MSLDLKVCHLCSTSAGGIQRHQQDAVTGHLCRTDQTAECNQFCHPVQRYAATKCKVMLPSGVTECCHLRRSPKGVQSLIHAGGVPRLRFGQDDVRLEFRGSKVRVADNPGAIPSPTRNRQFGTVREGPVYDGAYWKFSAIAIEVWKTPWSNHNVRPSREAARFAVHCIALLSSCITGVSRRVWKL